MLLFPKRCTNRTTKLGTRKWGETFQRSKTVPPHSLSHFSLRLPPKVQISNFQAKLWLGQSPSLGLCLVPHSKSFRDGFQSLTFPSAQIKLKNSSSSFGSLGISDASWWREISPLSLSNGEGWLVDGSEFGIEDFMVSDELAFEKVQMMFFEEEDLGAQ